MLTRLADRLVMCPSTHEIEPNGKTCQRLRVDSESVDIWRQSLGPASAATELFVLKFGGTGSRAELATEQPASFWPDVAVEMWSVNPPGYGGSSGAAQMKWLAPTGEAAFDAITEVAGTRPVLVVGNSLGTATALHVASRRCVAGLLLRNPPPLRQLIVGRHAWWSLWLGAAAVASRVPRQLDSIRNARAITAPVLFVSSTDDRIVPSRYQKRVIDAYGGNKRVLHLSGADHGSEMTEQQNAQYETSLSWLRSEIL